MKLFDVYPLFDVNIVKGQGCKVWDEKGQEYLDLYGGHAVISIGHCHPHYVEMMTAQLNKLGFYSNSVKNMLQVELAERLGKACGYEDWQFFLINSGAEANENALKLASFHNGRKRVLSVSKAFHGRTSLAVEVTNNPKIVSPINDNGHVTFLPMNDLPAWEAELAKGIGNGFPMSGLLISPEFTPVYGQLGTTFGGNHLACTAALAVLDVMEQENLVENARKVGDYLIEKLKELQQSEAGKHITDVRGRGLMVGVEFDIPHAEVRKPLVYEQHCFTGCAGTNLLRLLPPLCLTKENVDDFISRLTSILSHI